MRAVDFSLGAALLVFAGAGVAAPQGPDELVSALSAVRSRGCAGHAGTSARLRPVAQLGEAARYIARREPPAEATKKAGYRATRLFTVSMSGYASTAAVAKVMGEKYCKALTDPSLTDVGFHQQGASYWLVLAAPFAPPPPSAAAGVAARVLALTNEARSRSRQCGDRIFQASGPLKANALLDRASAVHAQDMARHGYLEHQGRNGAGPADRVRSAGYRWRSVGENIASGQTTPEQVVQEWIRSPMHCANLMSPGFTEMGLAYAVNINSAAGIYWVQTLGRPG